VDSVVDLSGVAGTAVDVVFLAPVTNGAMKTCAPQPACCAGAGGAGGAHGRHPASSRELARAAADDTLSTLIAAAPY
jgi:hypothetical protein